MFLNSLSYSLPSPTKCLALHVPYGRNIAHFKIWFDLFQATQNTKPQLTFFPICLQCLIQGFSHGLNLCPSQWQRGILKTDWCSAKNPDFGAVH